MSDVKFYVDYGTDTLYVCDPMYAIGKGAIFPANHISPTSNYDEMVSWWKDSRYAGYGTDTVSSNAVEILPNNIQKEKPMLTLKSLFENDFCVNISFNGVKALRVAELFQQAREKGAEFTIDEALTETWMEGNGDADYTLDNWCYFGISGGNTLVSDGDWGDHTLEVEDFEAIVNATPVEVIQPVIVTTPGEPQKEVIVLGDNLTISGGVVIVNYKTGKQFHLERNGRATLNVEDRTVITERSFVKDGQEAYERVIIKLENLDNVQSDTHKLLILGNDQVALVTLYTL